MAEPWGPAASLGVWDGQRFILNRQRDLKSRTWRELARDTWKYGRSPYRLQNLLETQLPRFRQLYAEYAFHDSNLSWAIEFAGLTAESTQTADEYLLSNGISAEFSKDIIQATARALFAHDLADLNGLSALIAMNPIF